MRQIFTIKRGAPQEDRTMRHCRNLYVGMLICVVGLVGLLSVERAEAEKGGLPACQAQLSSTQSQLHACSSSLTNTQGQLTSCSTV